MLPSTQALKLTKLRVLKFECSVEQKPWWIVFAIERQLALKSPLKPFGLTSLGATGTYRRFGGSLQGYELAQ